MKNCFDGYLTNACKSCPFWKDGTTNEGIGCAYPGPIDHCEAFKKMSEEEERKADHRRHY